MKGVTVTSNRNNNRARVRTLENLEDLIKKNPDVELAKIIMEQAKKTQKPAVNFDQSNYYKIP